MSASAIIDVSAVIERQRRNGLVLTVMMLSTAMMFLDGYDLHAMAFAAPAIICNWGIDKGSLGIVFSAGVFGILVGGLVFGYLGDRIGRRPSIVAATITFGGFSLLTVWAGDLPALIALRFLAGLGIGGLAPLCYSLNLEYVPAKYRGTVVAIIMLGYVAGGSAGGVIAAWLVPHLGWQIVFWIGGVLPLAAAALCFFTLPESIKFLVVHGRRPDEVARILNRIERDLGAQPRARFIIDEGQQSGQSGRGLSSKLAALFDGQLALITPLLWLAYIASSMTMFFLGSDPALLRLGIELLPRRSARAPRARSRGFLSLCDRLARIASAHRRRAFATSPGADPRLAFALLLCGAPFCFLALGALQIALVSARALIVGCPRLLQRDGDRLPPVLDLAAAAASQFAVLELMHHPTGDAPLPCRFLYHRNSPVMAQKHVDAGQCSLLLVDVMLNSTNGFEPARGQRTQNVPPLQSFFDPHAITCVSDCPAAWLDTVGHR